MPASVNVHEAKTNYSSILERAHAGEEIILAKAGKPYARMVPLTDTQPNGKREPGGWPELASIPDSVWFEPMSNEELDLWEGKDDPFV